MPKNEWYSEAVARAETNGVGAGKFAPNGKITREQIATILTRYIENIVKR